MPETARLYLDSFIFLPAFLWRKSWRKQPWQILQSFTVFSDVWQHRWLQNGTKKGRRCNLVLVPPMSRFPVSVASRARLAYLSWDILVAWPKQRSWNISIRKRKVSAPHDLRISQMFHDVSCNEIFANIQTLPIVLHSFKHYPKLIAMGVDCDKHRFKNWKLCGVSKVPFCDHRTIGLTQNSVYVINPVHQSLYSVFRHSWMPHKKKSESHGGFEQVSSSTIRQVMTGQSHSHYCDFAVLKRF